MLEYITPTLIFPIATLFAIVLFFINYLYDKKEKTKPSEGESEAKAVELYESEAAEIESETGAEAVSGRKKTKRRFTLTRRVFPMTLKDTWILLLITIIYGFVAFWGLGDRKAPQTFYHYEGKDYTFTLSLDKPREISKVMYYTGLYTGDYSIRWSEDGSAWSEITQMPQSYAKLFNWLYAPIEGSKRMRYIQVWSTTTPMEMGELALYDSENKLIPVKEISFDEKVSALFDEQDKVPESPTYMNSAYFDEIYHARTAYEHMENVYPYEVSHPPLGKLIIGIGIRLFGLTPFGWRFMGTLFGVLMLPFIYVFIKNMFGKTLIAASGTILFAFDFMHFVQTRIATIDTYGVFFILAMFFFMYRYIAKDYRAPFKKTALPLFLSGLMFGIGAASKWIVIYGAVGLALIWLLRQVLVGVYYVKNGQSREFIAYEVKTVLLSVLSFIIIPAIIYVLSYIPYGMARDMTVSGGMLSNKYFYDIILENQRFMFSYHSELIATHPYSSPWYSWIFDIRPILYYLEYLPNNQKSAFGAFGNPLVWWGGLVAFIYVVIRFVKTRDDKALFIIIGLMAQLLPWVIISRIVFIYHYFPSTLFLVLSICYAFDSMFKRDKGRYKLAIAAYTAAAVVLFIAFYPVLTGISAPRWYTTNFLQWLPSWPF